MHRAANSAAACHGIAAQQTPGKTDTVDCHSADDATARVLEMRSDTKGLTARRLYPHCDCTADRLTRRRRSLAVRCTMGTYLSSMGSAVGPHGVPSARRLRLSFTSTVATACCTLRVAPCMRQCPRNVLPVAVYCAVLHCCMAYCSMCLYGLLLRQCLLCQLWSPVRHAVERNHAAAAEWLLQHASADAELADPTGCRPLHRAVRHWPARYGTGPRSAALATGCRPLHRAVRWQSPSGSPSASLLAK